MSLDLRNFVNININYNSTNVSSVSRGVVTLITINSSFTKDGENAFKNAGPNKDGIFYSVLDFEKAKQEKEIADTSLDNYVKAFFGNKGKALQIIGGYTSGDYASFILGVLESLDYKFVIIVSDVEEQVLRKVATQSSTTNTIVNPITSESTVSTFTGLNEKYFISSTTDISGRLFDSVSTTSAPAFVPNRFYQKIAGQYIVLTEKPKGSAPTWEENTYYEFDGTNYNLLLAEPGDWATNWTNYYYEDDGQYIQLVDTFWEDNYANYYEVATTDIQNYLIKCGEKGIEMLAAAYLSKVRITDASTIQDYAFTVEEVKSFFPESIISDNDAGVNLVKGHINFDTQLVNAIRNYPGDTIHGDDMMNYYIKILLTQDLTESVMNLLASKIRFNQTGINRLNNAISQTMSVYVSNGYLNTEYIWTEDDLYYSYNGREYLICTRNTPIVKGYKCVILPLTSLTNEQKEAHVLPPVYLLLADQTGIRMIVINGDVY